MLYIARSAQELNKFDEGRVSECAAARRCQICGCELGDASGYGIPRFAERNFQSFNGESLMHRGCLRLALTHCEGLRAWIIHGRVAIVREPAGQRYSPQQDGLGRFSINVRSVDWEVLLKRTDRTDESRLKGSGWFDRLCPR